MTPYRIADWIAGIAAGAGFVRHAPALRAKFVKNGARAPELGAQLEKIARRVANLETILLERSREGDFEESPGEGECLS